MGEFGSYFAGDAGVFGDCGIGGNQKSEEEQEAEHKVRVCGRGLNSQI